MYTDFKNSYEEKIIPPHHLNQFIKVVLHVTSVKPLSVRFFIERSSA